MVLSPAMPSREALADSLPMSSARTTLALSDAVITSALATIPVAAARTTLLVTSVPPHR
jgi:hypothetical protein